jgi:hypothetical protein
MAAARVEGLGAMTLGKALEFLRAEPWGCACVGGPWCCRLRYAQAHALVRAAHVVVKQLAELSAR